MGPSGEYLEGKGIRVHLKMLEYVTSGYKLENYKSQMAKIRCLLMPIYKDLISIISRNFLI
jgi:hypothetical protein